MFEALTQKLTAIFQRLGNRGRLTERDVDEALREVRLALLEADVHFKVVRDFIARVRERAIGQEVLQGINPAQQVVKIVYDELTQVLSAGEHRLRSAPQPPTVVLLVGLQGSGKTTTAAKLALYLRRNGGQRSLLVACDLKRPAAVQQLQVLGKQLDIPVYAEAGATDPVGVARNGLAKARQLGVGWAIFDTGGRLHIDEEMMAEVQAIKEALSPHEVLLVLDAMTGQDAVRSAGEFHQRLGLTGLILTKLDGDARGGAALSITAVTGVPIKFVGVGERPDALEVFYPDRMAQRILGMGDVLSLVEKAQQAVDQQRARELQRKLETAKFDLQDFLEQLRALRRMGPLQQVLEHLPGFAQMKGKIPLEELDEKHLKRIEAIILSMTPQERRHPEIIDGSRRRRIAKGSGTTVQEVNALLKQFAEMQALMKRLAQMRKRGLLGMLWR
ncbi:MAG: signal recognition particle protein [Dehalococcoidia bacterium]|nr:signal recognition particle protein [Dehalococcoidia bacterium]MDW8119880.1 signal recognition particle protein [Chloroflexota bacterium]